MEAELQWGKVEDPLYCVKTFSIMVIAAEVLLIRENSRLANWRRAAKGEEEGQGQGEKEGGRREADPLRLSLSLLRLYARLSRITANAAVAVIDAYDRLQGTQRKATEEKGATEEGESLASTEASAREAMAALFCTLPAGNDSLLLFALQSYMRHTWFLRQFQGLYLGASHPDMAATTFDLLQSLDLLLALFPQQSGSILQSLLDQYSVFDNSYSHGYNSFIGSSGSGSDSDSGRGYSSNAKQNDARSILADKKKLRSGLMKNLEEVVSGSCAHSLLFLAASMSLLILILSHLSHLFTGSKEGAESVFHDSEVSHYRVRLEAEWRVLGHQTLFLKMIPIQVNLWF